MKLTKCDKCGKKHSARSICFIINQKNIDIQSYILRYKEGESANNLAKELGIFAGTFIALLKLYDIETRTVKESASLDKRKELYKETCLKNYGQPHNFCKEHPSRQKQELAIKEKYGVDNVFQLEEVKNKIRETMLKKYNVESAYKITTARGKNSYSRIHRDVVEELQNRKIPISIEKKLGRKNAIYFSYDINVDNTNLLIEVNGDYWHGNPALYKPDDIIMKNSSAEVKVSDRWKKDKEKLEYAAQNGFKVYVIWEQDLIKNKEKTYSQLLEWINENRAGPESKD